MHACEACPSACTTATLTPAHHPKTGILTCKGVLASLQGVACLWVTLGVLQPGVHQLFFSFGVLQPGVHQHSKPQISRGAPQIRLQLQLREHTRISNLESRGLWQPLPGPSDTDDGLCCVAGSCTRSMKRSSRCGWRRSSRRFVNRCSRCMPAARGHSRGRELAFPPSARHLMSPLRQRPQP